MGLCLCSHVMEDDRQLAKNLNLQRDITVVRNRIIAKKLPVVWMNSDNEINKTGIGGNSRNHSHACNIADRFGYTCISLERVLKDEAEKHTQRGKTVKNKLHQKKKMSDRVIIDLLKEKMIEAGDTRGYLISGFPLNPKQSSMFVKEITHVDCVIVLEDNDDLTTVLDQPNPSSKTIDATNNEELDVYFKKSPSMSDTETTEITGQTASVNPSTVVKKEKSSYSVNKQSGDRRGPEKIRSEYLYKDLYTTGNLKYDMLIEKINTNEPPADVFMKIEAAILDRLSVTNI